MTCSVEGSAVSFSVEKSAQLKTLPVHGLFEHNATHNLAGYTNAYNFVEVTLENIIEYLRSVDSVAAGS